MAVSVNGTNQAWSNALVYLRSCQYQQTLLLLTGESHGWRKALFSSLYGQLPEISVESARFTLFTRTTESPKIMALPPTSPNLMLHLLRAHLQVMLCNVADHLMNAPTSLTLAGRSLMEDR